MCIRGCERARRPGGVPTVVRSPRRCPLQDARTSRPGRRASAPRRRQGRSRRPADPGRCASLSVTRLLEDFGKRRMDVPRIISVDDHVVEPPHVWQAWLPAKYRERGPRVERKRWGGFVHHPGAKYTNIEDPDGDWGDAWYFEDRLIYVHKKFVAIPLSATPDGDVSKFDRTVMTFTATTYDEMRPGCYDPEARIRDFELNWVDGSLPFPTFPRFCGQTFYEAQDRELGLACIKADNDWMVEER